MREMENDGAHSGCFWALMDKASIPDTGEKNNMTTA
jgi:hypothetical protein